MEHEDGGELLRLGLCLFVIPTVGWLISAGFAVGDEAYLVTQMVVAGYALGALIFLLIIGAPKLAGTDRNRMSAVFGPSARLVMLLLSGSVLVQACLLIYSLFTLEASTIGRVHFGIIIAVGLGAVYVCLALIKSAFGFFQVHPMSVRAHSSESPALRARVNQIADQLGAGRPDNIIVGLEPNFYVTSAPVTLVGFEKDLSGTTLYVSLSLMRILSNDELNSVIGHELGHFRGSDTIYSLKFAPTYARLTQALSTLANGAGNASDLGRIPALAALSAYLNRFAASERSVGRERELIADQAGVSVANAKALATALLKVAIFSGNWNWLTTRHIEELGAGRTFTQLSITFTEVSKLASDIDWTDLRDSVAATIQSHPTDTHPTFSEGLEALGLTNEHLTASDCDHPVSPSVNLVHDADELDAQLSDLEANWLTAIGAARLPQAA
jgi:Zn-dependent protease with chaperone function